MQCNKRLRKKNLALVVSAATTMLAGGVSSGVYAQDTLEEITVTGSRIARRDLNAPSPIVTVGAEEFENSATTSVESVLNQMPQFVPSGTQFVSSTQMNATSTPGAATLNLRGMGTNRNLVLIDGKRAQPVNSSLVVDINTIPASAIANVEVITGGASAVYGPDAMAGVVNFILKDNFEGFEIDAQTGTTDKGDGQESKISMLMGANSGDGRANVMIGLDVTKREDVLQKDRAFYRNGWSDSGNASGGFVVPRAYFPSPGNRPTQEAIDSIFPSVPPGTVGTSQEIYFNEDGTAFAAPGAVNYKGPLKCFDVQECGAYTGMNITNDGDLTQFSTEGVVSTPMERYSFFMKGDYELADNLNAFMQVNYTHNEIDQGAPGWPPAITIWQAPNVPRDGRALPSALNTLLDSRPDPAGDWSLFQVLYWNSTANPNLTNDVWQFQTGLDGELRDGDWTWEAYVSRGSTKIVDVRNRLPSLQRYQQLIYAADFGKDGMVSNPDAPGGFTLICTSGLPVFQNGFPSEDCLDSIDTKEIHRNDLTQDIAEANLQGGLGDWFELPSGEVRFAVGASYRKNEYQFNPGNPLGQVRDTPIGLFVSNATGGSTNVKEIYGELLVPILDNLSAELGYRYSDFNTAGGTDTYKALGTWQINDTFTIRGGYQFATRAPNVAELFSAPTQQVVFHPDEDPCSVTTQSAWGNVPSNPDRLQVQALCRAIIGNDTSGFDTNTYNATYPGIEATGPDGFTRQNPRFFPLEIAVLQGNPDVGPEEGKTYTIGAVINEPFGAENLNVTVDYYDIKLADAISPISVATVYNNCFNYNGTSNPSYDVSNDWCQMITRNAITGDRQLVESPFFNLGSQSTRGVDVNLNWSADIGPGTFNVNASGNYLAEYKYQTAPTDRIVDARGTLARGGLFKWQSLTRFGYFWDDFNVGLTWKHLDSARTAAAAESPTTTILGPGSYDMFNLRGGYNWNNYSFRFGVDNLFDTNPELTQSNPAGGDTNTDLTSPGLYDLLGRRYYLGVKVSF